MTNFLINTKIKPNHVILVVAILAVCLSGLGIIDSPHANAQTTPTTQGQSNVNSCKKDFFGLEPWYQYIGVEVVHNGTNPSSSQFPYSSCDIPCFNIFNTGNDVGQPANSCSSQHTVSDIPLILLAVVDDLLRIAGLVTLAFIIYGAFEYVGSQGNSEVTAKAQSMVINALIGLTIATISVVVVNFIGNNLGT